MPTEAVSPPVTSGLAARSSSATRVTVGTSRSGRSARARSTKASSRESGSTRGETARSALHHPLARLAVGVEAAAEERRVRAARPGLAGRHRRADAVLARLVGRGRHHAPAADAADHDRLAAQRRLVALLDGGEEGVEVEVQDGRVGPHAAQRTAPRRPGPARRRPAARPQARSAARSSTGARVAGVEPARAGIAPCMETSTHDPDRAAAPRTCWRWCPVVLGFTPDRLARDADLRRRAALPRPGRPARPTPRRCAEVVASLLEPAARHGVSRVLLVGYTDDLDRAERVTGEVRDAFERAGIEVIGGCRPTAALVALPREEGERGTPYDVSAPPVRRRGGAARPRDPRRRGRTWPRRWRPDPTARRGAWPRSRPAGRPRRQRPAEAAWARGHASVTAWPTAAAARRGALARLLAGLPRRQRSATPPGRR